MMRAFRNTLAFKGLLVLSATILADYLFFHQPAGLNLTIYAAALLGILSFVFPQAVSTRPGKLIWLAMAGITLGLAYHPNLLMIALFSLGMITIISLSRRAALISATSLISDSFGLLLEMPRRVIRDDKAIKKYTRQKTKVPPGPKASYFAIPFVLSAAFILLFSKANPVIAEWLHSFDFEIAMRLLAPARLVFWGLIAISLWAVLRPRFTPARHDTDRIPLNLEYWINARSLIFSLLAFNGIFLFQNALDLFFLWSGGHLPEGMTYARYAQDGAYPLILTALLAAGYVLIVFSEHQKELHSVLARRLVMVWIAQNLFMVASAALRLSHYIEAYSLTYLRIAALIWMGLVAGGLILIMLRLFLQRSNLWLVNANVLMLVTVLYGCAFTNFAGLIAQYNLNVRPEVQSGQAVERDMRYIGHLGYATIPALKLYLARPEALQKQAAETLLANLQAGLSYELHDNWRTRTLHKYMVYTE